MAFPSAPCFPSWMFGLLVLGATARCTMLSAAEPTTDEFVLRESLGQTWRNECVRFELTTSQAAHVRAGHALIGPQGKALPYQLESDAKGGVNRIAFAVDLDPFEERRYRFVQSASHATATDIKLREQPEYIELSNGFTGISLRRKAKPGEGPIDGLRLASGGWIGGSQLRTGRPVTEYSMEITARGPVFVEAVCRTTFSEGNSWEMKVRVQAHEPVVLIEEAFATDDDSAFRLSLGTDYSPDRLVYRAGNQIVGANSTAKIAPDANDKEPLFVLEPWLHWWERDRQGNWFGLYSSTGSNLVVLGALEPGQWVDPATSLEKRSAPQIPVAQADGDLWATFPLRNGRRKWMIATLDQDAGLAMPPPPPMIRGYQPPTKVAPLPQKYLIKHGDFPLDRVKDATGAWKDEGPARARLVSEELAKAFRQRFQPNPDLLDRLHRNPVRGDTIDEQIACFVATQDAELGKHLASEASRLLQEEVDRFLKQDENPTLGVEPHRRANSLLPAVNLAAFLLETRQTTAAQTQRLRAQLAFLADTVSRPDFYSPARGYSANPNMTSTVAAFQVRIAGAIPSHPKAAAWMSGGMNELKRELEQWSDDNGGWLEAPHYALVAYDSLLGCFLAAQQAGTDDVLYHPKMRRIAEWLAKISTPPNSRLADRRHLPPIGNTYQQEPTGVFGHMALLWRDRDPQFSAHMQWMHRQQGSPASPGIGGFYPTLAGFRLLLRDAELPATAPDWQSELFPEAGLVLRSGFPSARETQLHLIAGRLHDHYDDDSGSFTLWGKGRLLANDFGYTGIVSAEDHNLLVSPATQRGVMRIEEFATTERFDSVCGVRDGWTRQIAFVKDPDPLGPNYFVVSDTLREPAPMKWQLWLTADRVATRPQAARVEGQEDVDLDVVFAASQEIALRTEEKSRTCPAMQPDGSVNVRHTTTQTGLIAELSRGDKITAVLFPRLKSEKPPDVTSLAGGKVIRVRSSSGDDYVFLNPTPFTFRDDGVSFEGTSGVIQLRGARLVLALGASGAIAARGHELRDDRATLRTWSLTP